jgi:hypothetical protein
MSRRSILLATTVCICLGSSAAIEQASAHGGGGGGFHSAGMSPMSSQTVSPTSITDHRVINESLTGTIVDKPAIPSGAFPPNSSKEPAPTVPKPLGPAANVHKPGIAPGGFLPVTLHIVPIVTRMFDRGLTDQERRIRSGSYRAMQAN